MAEGHRWVGAHEYAYTDLMLPKLVSACESWVAKLRKVPTQTDRRWPSGIEPRAMNL